MGSLGVKDAVHQGRVKLHTFMPSRRRIWTVVGHKSEHWVDPHHNYCTCHAYYFAGFCYHTKCQAYAHAISRFATIDFDDKEFDGFLNGLLQDVLPIDTPPS